LCSHKRLECEIGAEGGRSVKKTGAQCNKRSRVPEEPSGRGPERRGPRGTSAEDRERRATRETAGDLGAAGYRGEPTAGERREDRWRDKQAKALKTGRGPASQLCRHPGTTSRTRGTHQGGSGSRGAHGNARDGSGTGRELTSSRERRHHT
jgi:hypothetical protein